MEAYLQIFPKNKSELLMKTSQHLSEEPMGTDTGFSKSQHMPSGFSSAVDFHMRDSAQENTGHSEKMAEKEKSVPVHHANLKTMGWPDALEPLPMSPNATGNIGLNEKSNEGKRPEELGIESTIKDAIRGIADQKILSGDTKRQPPGQIEHDRILASKHTPYDRSGEMKIVENLAQSPKEGVMPETLENSDEKPVESGTKAKLTGIENIGPKSIQSDEHFKLMDRTSNAAIPGKSEMEQKQPTASVNQPNTLSSSTRQNDSSLHPGGTILQNTETAGQKSVGETQTPPPIHKDPEGLKPNHLIKAETRQETVNRNDQRLVVQPGPVPATNRAAVSADVTGIKNMSRNAVSETAQGGSDNTNPPEVPGDKTDHPDTFSNHRRRISESGPKGLQPIADKDSTYRGAIQSRKDAATDKISAPEYKTVNKILVQGESFRSGTGPELVNRNVLPEVSGTPLNGETRLNGQIDQFIHTDTRSGGRDGKSVTESKISSVSVEAHGRKFEPDSLNQPEQSPRVDQKTVISKGGDAENQQRQPDNGFFSKAEITVISSDKHGEKIMASGDQKAWIVEPHDQPDTQNSEVPIRNNRASLNPSGVNTETKGQESTLSPATPAEPKDQNFTGKQNQNPIRQSRRSNLRVDRQTDSAMAMPDFPEQQAGPISESVTENSNFAPQNTIESHRFETPISQAMNMADGFQQNTLLNSDLQTLQDLSVSDDGASDMELNPVDKEKSAFFEKVAKPVMNQVAEKIKYTYSQGKSNVNLELKPDSLGHLRVDISSESNQVSIRILAETAMAKEIIEQEIYQLKGDLRDSGLEVEKLDVFISQDSKQHQHAGRGNGRPIFQPDLTEESNKEQSEKQPQETRGTPRTLNNSGIDFFA